MPPTHDHIDPCSSLHGANWSCKDTSGTNTSQTTQTNPSSLIFGNGCDDVFQWNSCRSFFLFDGILMEFQRLRPWTSSLVMTTCRIFTLKRATYAIKHQNMEDVRMTGLSFIVMHRSHLFPFHLGATFAPRRLLLSFARAA